jgi:ribonucleotide monophosphatase NagD (HAD superfamily)
MVRNGVGKVLVLGSEGVGHALREAGIETRTFAHSAPTEVDAVYVGWHPDCGMKDIEAACNAIFAGAKLYVASDVPFFATRAGRTIGYSYAIVGAIRRVTRAPTILTGKPSRHAMQFVAKRLGVPVTRVGVVGDDPVVEMSMARRYGAAAFAVTTGVTPAAEWRRQPATRRPHRVLSDLRQVLDLVPG